MSKSPEKSNIGTGGHSGANYLAPTPSTQAEADVLNAKIAADQQLRTSQDPARDVPAQGTYPTQGQATEEGGPGQLD